MFKRFWVSLSVSFAAVLVVFAVVVLALLLYFSDNRSVLRATLLGNIESSSIPQQLVMLYERSDSWEPLIRLLEIAENIGVGGYQDPTHTLLLDANGNLIFSSRETEIESLPPERLRSAVALRSDTDIIGYLDVDINAWRLSQNAQILLIEQLQKIMIAVLTVAGLFGIGIGISISRTLTYPLERLTQWAVDVRKKGTSDMPVIEGSIEITSLFDTIGEMIVDLQQSEQLRRNLVADVAHELRTPLTVLQGNLYAILDDVYPCDKEQIAILYDQVRILSRLIHDLHQLSQVEANQFPFQMNAMQVEPLVKDSISQFQLQANEKQVEIIYEQGGDLPIINGDAERLKQVFNNIMSNALRHAYADSEITIRTAVPDNELHISVTNLGDEIADEHLTHLFDRFYRVSQSRDRMSGGTGLGLAISKAIIESHHGRIDVQSKNKHTTFSLYLPVQAN